MRLGQRGDAVFDPENPGDYKGQDNMKLTDSSWVTLEVPQNYSEKYDEAIDMAHYEVNDTIKLTWAEFQAYVRDKWSWSEGFNNTTRIYKAVHNVGINNG